MVTQWDVVAERSTVIEQVEVPADLTQGLHLEGHAPELTLQEEATPEVVSEENAEERIAGGIHKNRTSIRVELGCVVVEADERGDFQA